MQFFYSTEPQRLEVTEGGRKVRVRLEAVTGEPGKPRAIPASRTYVTMMGAMDKLREAAPNPEAIVVLDDDLARRAVIGLPDFPKEIGFYRAGVSSPIIKDRRNPIAVAIINGMGANLGDSIVGLRALELFKDFASGKSRGVAIDLFQTQKEGMSLLYAGHPAVRQVVQLPCRLSQMFNYHYFITLSNFIFWKEFDQFPMIDFFIGALGLNPVKVPAARKRNRLYLPPSESRSLRACLRDLRAGGRRLLMFHPKASTILRSMPEAVIPRFIAYLIEHTDYMIVSAVPLAYSHQRFRDISGVSTNLTEFVTLVSQMDAIVTVDTVTYHIADAFNVPTVALLATIPPEFRTKYYATVEGIFVGEGEERLYMRHKGDRPEDAVLLAARYGELDPGRVVAALDRATKAAGWQRAISAAT